MIQKGLSTDVVPAGGGKIRFRVIVGGLCVIAACLVAKHYWGARPARADSDWQAAAPSYSPQPASPQPAAQNVRVPTLAASQPAAGFAPARRPRSPSRKSSPSSTARRSPAKSWAASASCTTARKCSTA